MIPLIEKDDVIKSRRVLTKSKNNRYGYMKSKVLELVPEIYERINRDSRRKISFTMKDIVDRLVDNSNRSNGINRSNTTIYAGLRYLLFFEGINVSMMNTRKEDYLIMSSISGYRYGLPESIIKTFDNMELDGWYIKRNSLGLSSNHLITKNVHKDDYGNDTYTLESDGNIYFDRRDLTEEQAVIFAKYMSGKYVRAPDLVYLTPINVVIPDEDIHVTYNMDIDLNKIGNEFRIVRSGNSSEFTAVSIYGKECIIHEHDIDSMIRGCSIYNMLHNFDRALMIEKVPERIEILKTILPEIKTKYTAVINDHTLIIVNSSGTFHISLIAGAE